MKKTLLLLAGAAMVLGQASAALAQDVAVIVANRDYQTLNDAAQVASFDGLTGELEAAGYDVVLFEDLGAAGQADALAALEDGIARAERLLIVLGGHVVEAGTEPYLLATDAPAVTGFSVRGAGLPLNPILELAAQGAALPVVVVAEGAGSVDVGRGVTNGLTVTVPPEPVTLIAGEPERVIGFVRSELLQPGRTLAEVLAAVPPLIAVRGALPERALVDAVAAPDPEPEPDAPAEEVAAAPDAAAPETAAPEAPTRAPEPRPTPPAPAPDLPSDAELWQTADADGTVAAYRDYLQRFPAGAFAGEARLRLQRLLETPVQRDARLEAEAGLSDDQLRAVQQDLATLGFYPFGIDGLFGPGTRGGIADWQNRNGFDRTGYITPNQITQLQQQAVARAAELRAARAAEDRQYWADTGAGADEAGIRAYLQLYPDGLFADTATQRLAEIEEERTREARAAEQAAWVAASEEDSIASYSTYLRAYPEGRFAAQAEAAIGRAETARAVEAESARAEAREASLGLDTELRRGLELRLQVLGFATGIVDGTFDADTRAGIAAYQADRGLLPTGFLDQFTLVRLVSEVVLQ